MPYHKDELKIYEDYLKDKGLKHTHQRRAILDIFLNTERHLSAEELYTLARKKCPGVGFATVYRTLKHLCECGLCREIKFEDGTSRYEHLYGHKHHDHIICTKCGAFVEVFDPGIEALQEKLFKQHSFHPQRHRMELYGVCRKCSK